MGPCSSWAAHLARSPARALDVRHRDDTHGSGRDQPEVVGLSLASPEPWTKGTPCEGPSPRPRKLADPLRECGCVKRTRRPNRPDCADARRRTAKAWWTSHLAPSGRAWHENGLPCSRRPAHVFRAFTRCSVFEAGSSGSLSQRGRPFAAADVQSRFISHPKANLRWPYGWGWSSTVARFHSHLESP